MDFPFRVLRIPGIIASMTEYAWLFLAAIVAGAMNSIAGGGTILTFPALIAFGMPSIQANATSTFALLIGIVGSLYGYRAHLASARTWVIRFAPVCILGGFLGAWLLTRTSEQTFDRLVPFLIFFATLLFLLNNIIRRFAGIEAMALAKTKGALAAAMVLQAGVALYGGYFGAGIGILMLATLGLLGLHHIHEMNAIKTILAALINIVAAAYFAFAGLIIWPQALVMTLGACVGYFVGAHYAQRVPQRYVRILIGVIGISLSLVFFWREFLSRG